MKGNSGVLLLIATVASGGLLLIFLDRAEYDVASDFNAAVECADTSSPHCYQLYPGVIQTVRRAQTSSGDQDAVDITRRNSTVHVSLLPSGSDSALIRVGSPVTVEWYVGSLATVWIEGRGIPTTANLANGHADVGFIGEVLIWLAALFGAVAFVNQRVSADLARASLFLREVEGSDGAASYAIHPRMREALFLPLGLALIAISTAKPFMNPDTRALAMVGAALACAPVLVRSVLTQINCRVLVDRESVTRVDWLRRSTTWPLARVERAAIGTWRWAGWRVPTLSLVGRGSTELFSLTSLDWSLDEVAAACAGCGIRLSGGYLPRRRVNWPRRALATAVAIPTFALVALSFQLGFLPTPWGG